MAANAKTTDATWLFTFFNTLAGCIIRRNRGTANLDDGRRRSKGGH